MYGWINVITLFYFGVLLPLEDGAAWERYKILYIKHLSFADW